MIVIVNKKKKDAHIVSIEKPKTLGYLLIAGTHGFKLGNMFRGFFFLFFNLRKRTRSYQRRSLKNVYYPSMMKCRCKYYTLLLEWLVFI